MVAKKFPNHWIPFVEVTLSDVALCLITVANPNAMSQSSQGEFLIHIAAGTGNVPMLECLIQRGAKIHATTQRLLTPLHYAARMGHVEAVNYLIMQGATINAVDNLMWTPLHYAAYHGQAGVVELLLKSGASYVGILWQIQ
jgi:ankyrin repeat protein